MPICLPNKILIKLAEATLSASWSLPNPKAIEKRSGVSMISLRRNLFLLVKLPPEFPEIAGLSSKTMPPKACHLPLTPKAQIKILLMLLINCSKIWKTHRILG